MIQKLEQIAMASHNGQLPLDNSHGDYRHGLNEVENKLGINFRQRVIELRRFYPERQLVAGDIGCGIPWVVEDMSHVEGISPHGLDLKPTLIPEFGPGVKSIIQCNIEHMPEVPDEAFQYCVSYNVLGGTSLEQSLPEIFRTLSRHGIADLDIAYWDTRWLHFLTSTPLHQYGFLSIASVNGQFTGRIQDYFSFMEKLTTKDIGLWWDSRNVRFELRKP
ncbi:hypothetical protein HYU13_00915 [Candidatus Woesearchaeota archaeon]|nr:hypothetical protein [Candidatus Woesearchaeota archaeon]